MTELQDRLLQAADFIERRVGCHSAAREMRSEAADIRKRLRAASPLDERR